MNYSASSQMLGAGETSFQQFNLSGNVLYCPLQFVFDSTARDQKYAVEVEYADRFPGEYDTLESINKGEQLPTAAFLQGVLAPSNRLEASLAGFHWAANAYRYAGIKVRPLQIESYLNTLMITTSEDIYLYIDALKMVELTGLSISSNFSAWLPEAKIVSRGFVVPYIKSYLQKVKDFVNVVYTWAFKEAAGDLSAYGKNLDEQTLKNAVLDKLNRLKPTLLTRIREPLPITILVSSFERPVTSSRPGIEEITPIPYTMLNQLLKDRGATNAFYPSPFMENAPGTGVPYPPSSIRNLTLDDTQKWTLPWFIKTREGYVERESELTVLQAIENYFLRAWDLTIQNALQAVAAQYQKSQDPAYVPTEEEKKYVGDPAQNPLLEPVYDASGVLIAYRDRTTNQIVSYPKKPYTPTAAQVRAYTGVPLLLEKWTSWPTLPAGSKAGIPGVNDTKKKDNTMLLILGTVAAAYAANKAGVV